MQLQFHSKLRLMAPGRFTLQNRFYSRLKVQYLKAMTLFAEYQWCPLVHVLHVHANGSSCERERERERHGAQHRGELSEKNTPTTPRIRKTALGWCPFSAQTGDLTCFRPEICVNAKNNRIRFEGSVFFLGKVTSPNELRQSEQQETQASVEAAPGAAGKKQRRKR